MRPGDENGKGGGDNPVYSPESPLQMDTGGDGDDDVDSSSSKRSKGQSGEKGSPPVQTPVNGKTQKFGTKPSLEDVLKGLIISQIRGPFVHVEEGLLNLLKQCLIAEQPFFTSAALSGHVDHFESVDDEDLGWGCGWRNIQILCSFLLAEDPEAREALFNGAGFVPDIPALQRWLEIAWNKGFDEPGAEYFNWAISGTRKWIGTTECAALLRSFGIRAKIVSFTALGGKRARNGVGSKAGSGGSGSGSAGETTSTKGKESSEIQDESVENCSSGTQPHNSRGGAVNCDECGNGFVHGTRRRGIGNNESDLCEGCTLPDVSEGEDKDGVRESRGKEEQEGNGEPSDNQQAGRPEKLLRHEDALWKFECDGCGNESMGRRYKSLVKKDIDLCSTCMKEIEEKPGGERGSPEDYVIIEEFPASRHNGPHDQAESEKEQILDTDTADDTGTMDRGGKSAGGKDVKKDYQETSFEGTTEGSTSKRDFGGSDVGQQPLANEERGKAGMLVDASGASTNDINHHHLIEWVWSYFTEDSARKFSASSLNSRDQVTMSKRSPLYFQHRGHSRTIVGIERRRKPTGISEDVYLLVLDPSQSTELIVKSLREKSGWQKLIKNDVHTLRESEYQLCYADPGVAEDEELEQLKVLSSLRYSYYSK